MNKVSEMLLKAKDLSKNNPEMLNSIEILLKYSHIIPDDAITSTTQGAIDTINKLYNEYINEIKNSVHHKMKY